MPVASGTSERLVEAAFAEFRRRGIPASRIGPCPEAPARPGTTGIRAGADAIVVVIDRSTVRSLFGGFGDGRLSLRSLRRATRARSCENQLCEMATGAAIDLAGRHVLIVCDAGKTSPAERTRAIRWVREVAHRIGYECSINGLRDLGTASLIVVADSEVGTAARSIVEWYRSVEVR